MKVPELQSVESSNIHSMGHDDHGLYIRFKGGGLYHYPGVPRQVYENGLEAESKGSWFRRSVRGKYKHKALDD